MLTVDLVRRGAVRWGDRTAIECGATQLTFSQVDRLANRFANALIGLGLEPQETVGLLVDNGPYSVSIDFACLKARAVRVPLNSRLSEAEHLAMLEQTKPRFLVASASLRDRAEALAEQLQGMQVLCREEAADPDWIATAADSDPFLATPPNDIVLALHIGDQPIAAPIMVPERQNITWPLPSVGAGIATGAPRPGSDIALVGKAIEQIAAAIEVCVVTDKFE